MKNWRVLPVLLLVLTGCSGFVASGPGPFEVRKTYSVELGKPWTVYPYQSSTGLQGLTIDGVALNSLTFGSNIKDGKALIFSTERKKLIPRFRADMSEREVVEFIRDTLAFSGLKNMETSVIRAEIFGNVDGVRFDLAGDTSNGLNMKGTAKAAIVDRELQLIIYMAPAEHYFGLHIDEVNAILDSVTLL